jgi:ribosomal protein S18 acetylase RimI-like enzyme
MRVDTYPAYLEAAIKGYAEENVATGRWPQAGAVERSREDFESLLPQGLGTPDNFVCEIFEEDCGPVAGYAWYALERKHGACTAYIYDLEVKPEYRRRGIAYRALKILEQLATEAGAASIGLNVFANNAGAQALYQKLGYAPTNFNMRKPLEVATPCP